MRLAPVFGRRERATLACFLAYFVMSGMLAPIGIILPPLADHLQLPVERAAPLLSWLTLGILAGSALSLVVFDLLSVRRWLLLVYAAIAFALVYVRFTESPLGLRFALGVVGSACGIGLAAAASTITALYRDDRRASMLVITDSSFSVAGIAVSSLAVALVTAGLHWSAAYLAVALVAALVVVLVASVPESEAASGDTAGHEAGPADSPAASTYWPLPVWLCLVALFLYTLGQYCLLWWLPTYLETELGAARGEAGVVVARFWSGMFIAQLFVAWWVLRIGARRLVLLSVSCAFAGTLPLWQVTDLAWLPWLSALWGLANLGLLKVLIAFATLAMPRPSPRLVAALLFGATSGTAISPAVTGAIAGAMGARGVLQFGSLCYGVLALLVFLAWWTSAQRHPFEPMEHR